MLKAGDIYTVEAVKAAWYILKVQPPTILCLKPGTLLHQKYGKVVTMNGDIQHEQRVPLPDYQLTDKDREAIVRAKVKLAVGTLDAA